MDKAVFRDLFIDKEKTRNVAEKYNVDTSVISEIKHRVLNKCRMILKTKYQITSYSDIA